MLLRGIRSKKAKAVSGEPSTSETSLSTDHLTPRPLLSSPLPFAPPRPSPSLLHYGEKGRHHRRKGTERGTKTRARSSPFPADLTGRIPPGAGRSYAPLRAVIRVYITPASWAVNGYPRPPLPWNRGQRGKTRHTRSGRRRRRSLSPG